MPCSTRAAARDALITVATWNVRHGRPRRGFTSNRALLTAAASLDADLLAVQEVERHVIRSWFADQPHRIAAATTASTHRYQPARRLALTGSDGVAVSTRGTIEAGRVHRWPGRVALLVRVDIDGRELSVVTTHLQNDKAVAQPQLDDLLVVLADEPRPMLLLGDFNLTSDVVRPAVEAAGFTFVDGSPTSPAWAPVHRLDHIAVDGLEVLDQRVVELPVSDHRAVVAELG